jgi:FixJ family two-component response regulator
MPSGAGHRGVTVCRLAAARLTVFLTLVALQGRSSFTQYIDATTRISSLTNREVQVMNLVIKGQRNKQIAFTLGISEKTVKAHRGNVMRKVSVDSVADLVRLSEIASKDIPTKGR